MFIPHRGIVYTVEFFEFGAHSDALSLHYVLSRRYIAMRQLLSVTNTSEQKSHSITLTACLCFGIYADWDETLKVHGR